MTPTISRKPSRKLEIEVYSDFDKRKLCNMLPNLQELYLKEDYSERIQDQDYISTGFDFMYPTTKLEIIEYFGHCELVCQLAMSNLCRHVNSLRLELSSCFESTVTKMAPRNQKKKLTSLSNSKHTFSLCIKLISYCTSSLSLYYYYIHIHIHIHSLISISIVYIMVTRKIINNKGTNTVVSSTSDL
jgi:hypothetical protein